MFKLIGIIVGAGLILLAGIAWLDASRAKKVSSQLHNELNLVIDQISEQPNISPQIENEKLPRVEQEIIEQIIDQAVDEVIQEEFNQPFVSDSLRHIFWKPFISISSAEGFAQRLSQQTGVEISVISDEKNEHRMTFPYIDEEDKQRILQLIQEKTGFEVI